MSFNYLEKSAKNRTVKYIEQLLKKYDKFSTSAAEDISALPNNAQDHVKSELSRVIDSHKNFNDYIGDDDYSYIISRNFGRSKNKSDADSMARLGVYDVSHIPAYTSQSLARLGTPSIRAATNNVPGKLPFMSRLLGNNKFLNKLQIAPRYRTQVTNKAYSPEQLQEIRSLDRKGSLLTHADNPMYEVVLNSKGAYSPRLVHDLYGVANPYFSRRSDISVADALIKRFGADNVHTIDSLVESIHPSKLYHGGSAATSIPGSKGYDGRRIVESVNDVIPDANIGMHEHKLNVLANSLKNAPLPIKNKIIDKLVRNLMSGGINLMRGKARRSDRITKGKTWLSPLPHVGVSYANHNSHALSDVFVPKNVMDSIIRDGARYANSDGDRARYFGWLLNDINNINNFS